MAISLILILILAFPVLSLFPILVLPILYPLFVVPFTLPDTNQMNDYGPTLTRRSFAMFSTVQTSTRMEFVISVFVRSTANLNIKHTLGEGGDEGEHEEGEGREVELGLREEGMTKPLLRVSYTPELPPEN